MRRNLGSRCWAVTGLSISCGSWSTPARPPTSPGFGAGLGAQRLVMLNRTLGSSADLCPRFARYRSATKPIHAQIPALQPVAIFFGPTAHPNLYV